MRHVMQRITLVLALAFILAVLFAAPVFAFSWNPIEWIKTGLEAGGWTALAWVLTAIAGLAVFSTILAVRIVKTMKEVGELLISFADAAEDRKFNPDELKKIAKDARDVCDIWRATPAKYTGG